MNFVYMQTPKCHLRLQKVRFLEADMNLHDRPKARQPKVCKRAGAVEELEGKQREHRRTGEGTRQGSR